ncbi:MAG: GtrA family protein [Bacilli bacterium]|nr:GtrA family protein [Bacilli bacterium]MDD4733776.1 GtrA family protein [Bacilli bacterium]
MKKIKDLYKKYREIINYIIVGGLTTLVSIGSYFIFSRVFDIENNYYFILANVLSWICAVTFAYIANKFFVFRSKTNKKETTKEAIKFIISRITTFFIDLLIMYILVKLIKMNNDISKIIVQFIIVVLNYIFSKLIVFKK